MMKRIMTLGATALVLVLMLDASEGQRPGRGSKSRVGGDGAGRLAEALSLTADQQAQLKSLRQQMHEQMESLRQQGTELRSEARSLRDQHRQQVRSILTPEQQQALAQLKADRPDGPRGGERAGRRARGRRLAEKLQLTQEQRDAMQDLRRVHRQQVQELRDGASREDLRALHQEHRDSIRQVLTEQQRQTLDQLRAARQSSKRRPRRERQLPPDGDPSLDGSARPGVEGTSWGDVKESVDGG